MTEELRKALKRLLLSGKRERESEPKGARAFSWYADLDSALAVVQGELDKGEGK